ncbi:MAG: 4'-phosphopantetheinyl transferase superfamily protein [Gammaproteobacteria bacterium]|nr:4'-phosphopantetheinyl transferase superfamily protein [Gammaproteobacteria bacterium]
MNMDGQDIQDNWQTAPARLDISPYHVDVWLASTELGEEQVRSYAKSLTETELGRARKFKSATKYREYVITRGLLRQILHKAAGLNLSGIDFSYGAHGKPYLEDNSTAGSIAFNVSHSHGLALVALAASGRLGVDLEQVKPGVAWRELAERYFSAAECRALQAQTSSARPRACCACWTRKEAFIKALGAGLSHGLKQFDVSVDPDAAEVNLTLRITDEDANDWQLRNLPMPPGYRAALALDRPACKPRLWRASHEQSR